MNIDSPVVANRNFNITHDKDQWMKCTTCISGTGPEFYIDIYLLQTQLIFIGMKIFTKPHGNFIENLQFWDCFKTSLKYFYYFLHSHLMSNQIDTISLSINFQGHLRHSDDLLLWVGVHRRAITVSPSETFPHN